MKDINIQDDGADAEIKDTNLYRAKNVADVQVGSLNYALEFGVDKRFFVESEFDLSTSSYASHVMERITQQGIPVTIAVKVASQFIDALSVGVPRTT